MALRDFATSLATEFRSLETHGPRAQEALEAALSVALWQGGMRLAGSAAGAAAGIIAFRFFAENQPAFCLCLFAYAWAGLFGFAASRFSSAWMFFGVTSAL